MDKFLTQLPLTGKAEDEASPDILPKQFPSKATTKTYDDTHLGLASTVQRG
ncbi:Hypothetical protein FKW44_004664 [Caligus rogercresseyi]|uniref:Uncharacterized protein n=1 Tax=Caligus rogercresseyi TaxID=217165 RepID=A0A7T8KAP1_CALRO|nr:Hypothetical protein FKW44_004664 [Caligus rogercresseyi]